MKEVRSLLLMSGFAAAAAVLPACGPSQVKPVELFPEDNCAHCRMAVSEKSFASEIITADGEIFKFDDLGCLEEYRRKNPSIRIGAAFVADYETNEWVPYSKSIIVLTGIATPMGSGKVAVGDVRRAKALAERFPPPQKDGQASNSCCSSGGH